MSDGWYGGAPAVHWGGPAPEEGSSEREREASEQASHVNGKQDLGGGEG